MINVVDEVLNTAATGNVIKYNVTHSDNTTEQVQIDLATPVTTQGTPINKALFDSIISTYNLVGRYNAPTVNSSASQSSGSYIPVFSSSTTPTGFSVTAGTSSSSAYRALDNNTDTNWASSTSVQASENWWQVMLDTALLIKEFTIVLYSNGSSYAGYINIMGSIDGVNFESINIFGTPTSAYAETKTISINTTKRYKYIRLVGCDSSGTAVALKIINLREVKITKWYANTSYNLYSFSNHLNNYTNGLRFKIQMPAGYVGGGVRVNINELGQKNVVIPDYFNFTANKRVPLVYNGTEFELDELIY